MSALSRLKISRPGQLLGLVSIALVLGLLVFSLLPNGVENMLVAAYKDWLLCKYATFGLIFDMVVFYRSRPGDTNDPAQRFLYECRRVFFIGFAMLAGAVAL